MFCGGDYQSAHVLKESLRSFYDLSGLAANAHKSNLYLSGVHSEEAALIINCFGFPMGTTPFKYLGIPLITTKLCLGDCSPLVDRVVSRIQSWENKMLSYAGRLQLIKSVLCSLQVYWASHLFLPKSVLILIEQKLRCFLWSGRCTGHYTPKVAWDVVCSPTNEGGLGVKSLLIWNKALMARHIWILITDDSSLWSSWIKVNFLRGNSFWTVSTPQICSWNWRKLLKIRDLVRPFIKHVIGDGESTSFWHDHWHSYGPLSRLGSSAISTSGIPLNALVSSIVVGESWYWPLPISSAIWDVVNNLDGLVPNSSCGDSFVWFASANGKFSTASAMDHLRIHNPIVCWAKLVWFKNNIPRASFILWLAVHGKLATLDRVSVYSPQINLLCPLCGLIPESISHIFFACSFSLHIWKNVLLSCGVHWMNPPWPLFIDWASSRWGGKSFSSIIKKLGLSVTVYLIWIERNNRIFRGVKCAPSVVLKNILSMIRCRLLSIKYKPSSTNNSIAQKWSLANA